MKQGGAQEHRKNWTAPRDFTPPHLLRHIFYSFFPSLFFCFQQFKLNNFIYRVGNFQVYSRCELAVELQLFADDLARMISIGRRRYGISAIASWGHRVVSTFPIIGRQVLYKKWLRLGPVLLSTKTRGGRMRSVLSHRVFVRIAFSFLFRGSCMWLVFY